LDQLVWLNLLLPVLVPWLVVIERRLSNIEGYLKGRREDKFHTRVSDKKNNIEGGV